MAAPTYVDSTRSADANTSTPSVAVPTGVQADDIVLISIEHWGSAVTITWPTGFTQIGTTTVSGSQRLSVAWKRLTGADSGSYTVTFSGTQWVILHAIACRGAITSGSPIQAFNYTTAAASQSISTTTDTFLVHTLAHENTGTYTQPTGYTVAEDAEFHSTSYLLSTTTGTKTGSGAAFSGGGNMCGGLIAVEGASGGTNVDVLQTSTTDTAQAVAKAKVKAAAQATTTEVAQVTGKAKSLVLNQATETDEAGVILLPSGTLVGLATERDDAHYLTVNRQTDYALGMSVFVGGGAPHNVNVNQATETDEALAVTSAKTLAVGQASESDTAQTITTAFAVAVGLVTETDTAQSITVARSYAVGQVSETDTAQDVTPTITHRYIDLNQASESDTAQSITSSGNKNIEVGLVTETDTAQVVASAKTASVGFTTETDTAQALASHKAVPVAQATETDEALTITSSGNKNIVVGLVTEVDAAQALASDKAAATGQATGSDSAQAIAAVKSASVGLVTETDDALPVSTPGETQVPLNQVAETDTAQSITPTITHRYVSVGQAASTHVAGSIRPRRSYTVARAVTADAATGITVVRSYPVGLVSETATAFTVSTVKRKSINLASETDEPGQFGDTLAVMYRRPSGAVPANSGGRAATGTTGGRAAITKTTNGAELL